MNVKPWLVGAVASLAFSAAARSQETAAVFHATTLDISAAGEIKKAPDQAMITLGVRTLGKTAADAMRANRERMNTTIGALTAQGVDKTDIQTTELSLDAQYVYEQNQPPRLTGYQASNAVTVTVHDLARLGATVDAVTAGGANQINGIAFGLSDLRPAQDEARRAAVKTLRAKAELLAQAEGLRVIRLVNLAEGETQGARPPVMFRRGMMTADAAPTPVEPGQLSVSITLSAVYELGN